MDIIIFQLTHTPNTMENVYTKSDRRASHRDKRKYAQVKHSTLGFARGLTKSLKKIFGLT